MSETSIHVVEDCFPVAGTFTISRGSRTKIRVVTVELRDGSFCGRGESVPYSRFGETVEGVMETIRSLEQHLKNGLDRIGLQSKLPPGAARNALDCAFWDLEAKKRGTAAWKIAGLPSPVRLSTAFTLSLADPDSMREAAATNSYRPLLKVKLGSDCDADRIRAVRAGAPHSMLIVDANEGWTIQQYLDLAPQLVSLGVAMVEQPLPVDADEALRDIERALPVCADESCHDRQSLRSLVGKYDAINIKLDKTGGLTEALELKRDALAAGFDLMVGCMLGTSLAMAPAFLLAQGVKYVDLDGPLLLAKDRQVAIQYDGSLMEPPPSSLWG
ncbi:N-acetyl-D-Glu racemase DgcA [Ensifer sp. ENS11]|uniref:N-acetyl-D-Glu racemase DgcA n=1 Tax=Ensifer sp. ENS11 TaxID=2769291 RepID=UPI00177EADCD|nr:N-acetyl-D-Glu racemase DgcA [Ensifer sp. ENS11]MBD9490509.1 dipeptide epimerase [Ensifer sp. ENS11]MDP9633045.1 L-alanine-DL-glutamate epimerase-like enolase superfamily enzyme [Ensifer adhaerens]